MGGFEDPTKRAKLGWMNGWFGRNVYAASSDYVGFLTLGESVTRSLVRAPRGPLSVLLEMLPTHARAHAHTCPHTRTDPEFGFLYFFGVSMCGVAAPA